ncbi:uncharacterized protein [Antedon mediterranea]|uniref:uncharacterized protein n=1 Tax=Antedon mediterranea TaxID=105859 RepID=UPI003AF86316
MTDLNEHFKDLKANLSKHYAGDHYRLVKLCLYDHLPLGDFEGRGLTAHNLFNKLQAKGYIEPSNVKLLMEIAKLTEFKVAEILVLEYVKDNNIKQTQINIKPMSPYRKRLFDALQQVEGDSLSNVIAYYNLEHFGLKNIWDVVFKLESNEELKDEPGKIEKFASLLNERAKKLLLDRGNCDESEGAPLSRPSEESGANQANQLLPVTETKPKSKPDSVPRANEDHEPMPGVAPVHVPSTGHQCNYNSIIYD